LVGSNGNGKHYPQMMDDMTLKRLNLTTSDNIIFIGIIYIKYKLFQIMEKSVRINNTVTMTKNATYASISLSTNQKEWNKIQLIQKANPNFGCFTRASVHIWENHLIWSLQSFLLVYVTPTMDKNRLAAVYSKPSCFVTDPIQNQLVMPYEGHSFFSTEN